MGFSGAPGTLSGVTSTLERDEAADEALGAGAATRSRPRRRWPWVLVALLAWSGWCGLQIERARAEATAGIDRLNTAKSSLTMESLVSGDGDTTLKAARRLLGSAHDRVSAPLLAPFRVLPFVGRQMRSVDALTGAAAEITDIGIDAMDRFRTTISDGQTSGPERVELTKAIGDIARTARDRVRRVDLGPGHALIGTLADGRRRFASVQERLEDGLGDLQTAALGMTSFLQGPTRYLLFAANNGEMRAGAGMFLSAGVLTVDGGDLSVNDLQSTTGLRLPADAVKIGGDLEAVWGWTGPNIEWRNLEMSPRFDATAELAIRMWKARTGQDVDGVMVIDPVALKAILAATGPVEVDGKSIGADNILDELMVQQYWALDGIPWDRRSEITSLRRNRLSIIAHAVLERVQAGGWDTVKLLDELGAAAKARHVLAWSSRPEQLAGWRAAGVSGELGANSLALSLLSQGGTKIDGWVPVDAAIERRGAAYTVRVTLGNTTPTGLPTYVQGPSTQGIPNVGVPEGVYAGIVALSVPGGATALSIDGVSRPVTEGHDGPSRVVATRVTVARGEAVTLTFRFTLPAPTTLVVEPSARLDPIHWRYAGKDWWDVDAVAIDSSRRS